MCIHSCICAHSRSINSQVVKDQDMECKKDILKGSKTGSGFCKWLISSFHVKSLCIRTITTNIVKSDHPPPLFPRNSNSNSMKCLIYSLSYAAMYDWEDTSWNCTNKQNIAQLCSCHVCKLDLMTILELFFLHFCLLFRKGEGLWLQQPAQKHSWRNRRTMTCPTWFSSGKLLTDLLTKSLWI